jgi:hypothetical protein
MTKDDVEVGKVYMAKVSGTKVRVQILRRLPSGGFKAKNLSTNRTIRIRTAARLSEPERGKKSAKDLEIQASA